MSIQARLDIDRRLAILASSFSYIAVQTDKGALSQ